MCDTIYILWLLHTYYSTFTQFVTCHSHSIHMLKYNFPAFLSGIYFNILKIEWRCAFYIESIRCFMKNFYINLELKSKTNETSDNLSFSTEIISCLILREFYNCFGRFKTSDQISPLTTSLLENVKSPCWIAVVLFSSNNCFNLNCFVRFDK